MKYLKEGRFGFKEVDADESDGVFYTYAEEKERKNREAANAQYTNSLDLGNQILEAENAELKRQLAEALEKVAAAESTDQAAELADLRDYVQRLKIANAELKNKARGLPKAHSGYVVISYNNPIKVPYEQKENNRKKTVYGTVYETVLQTPCSWEYSLEQFRAECFNLFITHRDSTGMTIPDKLGLKYDQFRQHNYTGCKNYSSPENYIYDFTFRGGRNGCWEVVIQHGKYIEAIPADMLRPEKTKNSKK